MRVKVTDIDGNEDAFSEFDTYGDSFDAVMFDLAWQQRGLQVLGETVDALVRRAAELTGRVDAIDTREEAREGSFSYIPYSLSNMMRELAELDALLAADPDYRVPGVRYRPVRFCEIGCGHGRNLLLLRHGRALSWAELHGIDILADMVELGRTALGLEDQVEVADALTYDYSRFDVVFSYRPFMDDALQTRLERHLEESMKVSAYMLAPLALDNSPNQRMLPVGTSGNLWKKIA